MRTIKARIHRSLRKARFHVVLKGHGFIRAARGCKISAALAAEGWDCHFAN
jgi:hypothetical protein